MRTSLRLLPVFIAVLMHTGCTASSQSPPQKVQRLPLHKSDVVIESPTGYEKEVVSYDPKTGEPSKTIDRKPRVEVVDARAGKYLFKWIGYDGKEKVVEYQRADAIDAVISATVTKTVEGKYLYTYKVDNLPSSATYLSWFIPQNFAADVEPVRLREGRIGRMFNQIEQFKNGNWVSYGSTYFRDAVTPGRAIEVQLVSAAPPGLVGCRIAGGEMTLQGAGEHMPSELEDMIPGYEELPHGNTIGPRDDLTTMSTSERAKYLHGILPQFRERGWITDTTQRLYEQALSRNNPSTVVKRAEEDLQTEQITSEVHSMIHLLLGTLHQQAMISSTERKM